MATKILGGLAVAVALTLVGVYAATGTVPGVETIADTMVESCPSHSCCQKDAATSPCGLTDLATCPAASGCPASDDATADPLGVTAKTAPKSDCCPAE